MFLVYFHLTYEVQLLILFPSVEETAKKKATQKKKPNTDESAGEESDDGDEEGRELDYISDSSERLVSWHVTLHYYEFISYLNFLLCSCSDHEAKVDKEMKGVSDETALRKMISSDEEDEEEEAKKSGEEGNKSEQEEPAPPEEPPQASGSAKKKRKREPPPPKPSVSEPASKNEGKFLQKRTIRSIWLLNNNSGVFPDTSSDFSADSSDSEAEKPKKNETSFEAAQIAL